MSARAIPVGDLSGTIDPVTGVIVIAFKLRAQAVSHRTLYAAIAADLLAGDPTVTWTKTIGSNGDADISMSIPTI
jgi:hypothetical protein